MGAHILDWLFGWLYANSLPTGWQLERKQDTGSYQLPALIDGIAGGDRWEGAPGTWAAAYRERHTGNTPIPPTPGETGAIERVPPLSLREIHKRHEMGEAPTAPQLPGTEWLYERIPTGALPPHVKDAPVLRQQVANPAPQSRQIAANTGAIDDMLTTLGSARDRYRLDLPALQDLPTVPSQGRVIEQTIEALPPAPEDFPRWLTVDPPTLIPLAEDVIASTDRTAVTLFADAATIHQEDDEDDSDTPTMHGPAVRERHAIEKIIKQIKESE